MSVISLGRFIFGETPWGIQSGCEAGPFYLQTAFPSCLQPFLHGIKSNLRSSHGCPQFTGQGRSSALIIQPLPLSNLYLLLQSLSRGQAWGKLPRPLHSLPPVPFLSHHPLPRMPLTLLVSSPFPARALSTEHASMLKIHLKQNI